MLLDKAVHPRPNVGESLIPHFWKYTDLIGATPAIEADGFVRKGGGLALWNGAMRRLRFSDFGYSRPALHVERDRFDHILIEQTRRNGVRVFEDTAALSIDPAGPEPSVQYRRNGEELGTLRARYIVDASGQGAVLARQLGIRQFDPDIRFTSLWGYYVGGEYLTIDGNVMPFGKRMETAPATLVTTLGDWGWVWHIVLRESVSIGIILPPERLQAFKARSDTMEARFQGIVEGSPIIGRLMRDATFMDKVYGIRDYAYMPTQLAVDRCYLAGDAAAFVDPINSAGVVFGMYAGFLSAWAISNSLKKPDRSDEFRASYCRLYGDRLALFRLLALPSDAEGVERAIENAAPVVRNTSRTEQDLMLLQATLNSRSTGIARVLQRLGLPDEIATRTVPVPELD